MRPRSRGAPNAYEPGVDMLVLWLADPPEARTRGGKTLDLGLQVSRTADGMDIALRLPFREFMPQALSMPPSEIGLDWVLRVADAEGAAIGHPAYGHHRGLSENPRLFTRAFLV